MADQDYDTKLQSLRRYVPFLINMMSELKTKGNREAQLIKIQSLHDMITDSRKKLKLETLNRCEEVLTNIYYKVNPQIKSKGSPSSKSTPVTDNLHEWATLPGIESPKSTPASPSPPRDIVHTKPVTIPTEKIDTPSSGMGSLSTNKSHLPKINVYSNVVIHQAKATSSVISDKVPDMSKPPISLDDLKTLEDDVQQKISDATFANASVDDLQAYRQEIELQLRVDSVTSTMSPQKSKEPINTTVRNNPSLSKKLSFTESKSKVQESSKISSSNQSLVKNKDATSLKNVKDSAPNKSPQKVLKDSSSGFGSLLSSIDSQILDDKKKSKKSDRRSSVNLSREDSGSTTSLSSDSIKETGVKTKQVDHQSNESKHKSGGEAHKHRRSSVDKEKHKHKEKNKDRSKDKEDDKKARKDKKKDRKEKHKSKERKDEDKSSKKESSKDEDKSLTSDKDNEVKKGNMVLLSDILLFKSKLHNNKKNISADKELSSCGNSSTSKLDCDKQTDLPNTASDASKDKDTVSGITIAISGELNKPEESSDMPKATPIYKRLADKYNPKPKSKTAEVETADVDKAVSDSIENLMKVSPAKSLLSPLGEPKLNENAVGLTTSPSNATGFIIEPATIKPVQLPDILQKIFSKPLLGELIPKRLNENSFPLTATAQNKTLNSGTNPLAKPGAVQPPEPPILSPPHRPLHFQPPDGPRSAQNFLSPHRQEFISSPDMGTRPNVLLPTPGSQRGILPAPPIPPSLPRGFSDHNPIMDMGYGTPRVDFDTPLTPMPDFSSPRVDFELPMHPMHAPRNEQFNRNQRFVQPIHQERQMNCFDPRNQNFMGPQFQPQPEMNMFNHQLVPGVSYYVPNNQMSLLSPEVPLYMSEQNFYQDRSWHDNVRWGRRPGDPRNYREYKEMKERQEREYRVTQEKQKEIKDPRLAPRDSKDGAGEKEVVVRDPRLAKDNVDRSAGDKSEATARDPRLSRGSENIVERERDSNKAIEINNKEFKGRDYRARSRDRETRERVRSRERALSRLEDLSDSRNSRSKPRERESRFDKMYSKTNTARSQSRSRPGEENEEEESFVSPLDSLYNAGEKGRTGRGYGVQNFKIPRKSRIDNVKRTNEKKDDRRSSSASRKKRYIVISDSSDESDTNQADNNSGPENDSDVESVEECELQKSEDTKMKSEKQNKERVKNLKTAEEKSHEPVLDTTRIKVIIKSLAKDRNEKGLNLWNTDAKFVDEAEESDFNNFVSEYDKEFQLQNKDQSTTINENVLKTTETKVRDVQVEEPSSSQDVTETQKELSSKVAGSFEKRSSKTEVNSSKKSEVLQKNLINTTESVEADSSKKSDGSLTPQESAAKSDEPSEQNILAHFFENLLKSKNKKDKKTALFSLIETFSDSFDTREIQKIRKIIKTNEDEEEESDEEPKGPVGNQDDCKNVTSEALVLEEQPVVGSTTEEVALDNNESEGDKNSTTEELPKTAETQVNEVKSSELSEQPIIEQSISESFNPSNSELLEPVIVSVGERIKNRKRNVTPPKPRKKGKTELDLLHEDIQDMFIRDGVLTATGKRMCRILKDDPSVLSVAKPDISLEPKKMRKKPGPKPKPKVNKDDVQNSMKDMRIVIKKMPDNVVNANVSNTTRQLRSGKRLDSYAESDDDSQNDNVLESPHQLRSRYLQSSYAESDAESHKSANDIDIGVPEDNESTKIEIEGELTSESEDDDNKSQNSDGISKPRVFRRRRGGKWASGIIPKMKKKKPQNKSEENSPCPSRAPSPDAGSTLAEPDFDKLVEPDKEYYYDYASKKKIFCKLCDYGGHLLTGHYLKEHPQSEVLCSRLAPNVASEAIKDFSVNGKKYESIIITKMSTKYHYCCRVCGFTSVTSPIFFYEHVTTHTGEYRHQCGICEYFAVTGKTMAGHFVSAHPEQEKKAIRRTYTLAVVFGYICGECNFLQLKQKSVEDHVNIFHLGEKPSIYKINMSTILDPVFNSLGAPSESVKALEHKVTDAAVGFTEDEVRSENATDNEASESTPPSPTKLRKKRTPKPKASAKETNVEDQSRTEEIPVPVFRKKPGPKSRTTVLGNKEQDEPSEKKLSKETHTVTETPSADAVEEIPETLPVTAIRKKPGPKSKTLKQKLPLIENMSGIGEHVEQSLNEKVQMEKEIPSIPASIETVGESIKEAPARKRRRSLDKLIPEDSSDDLDTIITLSSRSSRAAKDKATAKLKTLMESNEGLSTRKKVNMDATKKENDKGKPPLESVTTDDKHQNETEKGPSRETQGDKSSEAPIETQLSEMNPPLLSREKSVEKRDLNVFTCKTDILEEEEAKEIEEERLRKMEELNKSIGSRTSKLDFVDKLSSRLSNEQCGAEKPKLTIKQEPNDSYLSFNAAAPRAETLTMPILEKELPAPLTRTPPLTKVSKSALVSKKPIFNDDNPLPQSSINFRQNKSNSLFSNMIEKLQGKVNEAAGQQDDSNIISQSVSEETSADNNTSRSKTPEVLISIGDLITATKRDKEIIYSCRANKCYVATKDKMVFQLHCKFGHKDLAMTSSLCEKCGVVIETTPDTSLLENLYDHLVFAHSDCFARSSNLRMRKLSGDKLSVKEELTENSSTNSLSKEKDSQDFEARLDRHILTYLPNESSVHTVTTHALPGTKLTPAPKEVSQESLVPTHMETEPSPGESAHIPMSVNVEPPNEEPVASEATLELADDHPFSFKIANVVSLAQSDESEDQIIQSPPNQAKPKSQELPPLKPVPPLTLISIPKQQPSMPQNHLIVKEAKLSSAELSRPKKAPKALQKFVDTPGDLYKCPHFYCMFTTNNRMFLERHLRAHKSDSDSMVPCVYCDMKTPWEHVPVHIEIRHANCRFACSYCLYRAYLKEYVCLHQEQAHPDKDFIVLALPAHKAIKKFSIADPKIDSKSLCEPFTCICKGLDGKPVVKEYLFETEFTNHLNTVHQNKYAYCGYPGCSHRVNSSMMLNHWAMFHGICTYQCGYCKTSSKEITRIYSHFCQMHQSLPSDILVRVNEKLPKDRELGYSKEAFNKLGHIKKVPQNLLAAIGKRSQRSIKLVHFDAPSVESSSSIISESTSTASTSGGSETLYLVPVPPNKGQSITSMAPINKAVAQTSVASTAIVNRAGGSILAVEAAPSLARATVSPTTSSNLPPVPMKFGDTVINSQRQKAESNTTASSHATISVLSRSLVSSTVANPRSLIKIAGSKAGSDVSTTKEIPQRTESPVIKIVNSAASVLPQTTPVSDITPTELNPPANKNGGPMSDISNFLEPASEDATSQDSSTGLSEDDILQSAIQSILEADDLSDSNSNTPAPDIFSADGSVKSNNALLPNQENIFANVEGTESSPTASRPSTPVFGSVTRTVPPPLVLILNNSKSNKSAPEISLASSSQSTSADSAGVQEEGEGTVAPLEQVAPVEHIDMTGDIPDSSLVPEEVDPLNLDALESNEDSNSGPALFDDINVGLDSPPEDPLTIVPTLNSELPSTDDPLNIEGSAAAVDPLEVVAELESDFANQSLSQSDQSPLLTTGTRRSMSMVSNSDDESDSSGSEKGKKRGLMGYQLYRCYSCNLSFSNIQTFKSHVTNSSKCKKPGVRQYQCVHCEKSLKMPQRLADHIQIHGVPRFTCSLCNEKYPTAAIAKLHLKNRHNIHQTNLIPLKSDRTNMDTDDFMVKPGQANQGVTKDKDITFESPKQTVEDNTFNPDQINSIPIRQIFSSNVKCGKCNYQTKVRVNIVRHLQMHLEEKSVSDTAPVNPVPCLEKNEKMFDKMINLAASSITTAPTRMGGANQEKEKEEEKQPEFVPSHRRFVCAANGCSYLCPEEANLKHHLAALHSDDSEFMCSHCKKKIEPADPDNVLKHLKLHGLNLYKCHYCNFVHTLKHKVEKHVTDGHLEAAVKVITVRFMESEPIEFGNIEEVATSTPPPTTKFKPWRCCMCKVKCHTKEDMQLHIVHKHDVDTQYKCTLCTFKNDKEEGFKGHFKEKHPKNEIDIICVYQKVEEEAPKEDPNVTPFDTTPLWQRDKPRVRHIRGILFDESSPQPTKSPKKPPKIYTSSSSKVSPSSSTGSSSSTPTVASKNLFDCIEAVARGTAETLQNKKNVTIGTSTVKGASTSGSSKGSDKDVKEKSPPIDKKEDDKVVSESKEDSSLKQDDNENDDVDDDVVEIKQSPNIIVIDSDSDSEAKSESKTNNAQKPLEKESQPEPASKPRGLKRQGTTDLLQEAVKLAKIEEPEDEDAIMATNCSRDHLISIYGSFGAPHNKQWKCPKCHQFKSKRVGDFMFHIYKDFNFYRFKCKACTDLSITYKYMLDHIRSLHPGFTEDIIEPIAPNVKLETWIHMAIREQSLAILKNAPLMKKRSLTGPTDISCYFCNERFMSMPECCEHMLYHWVMMPYQCQHCPNEFYTVYDLKHHHNIEHPDLKLYLDPKGPTLAKALQCIENIKKRPVPRAAPQSPSRKKAKVDNSKDAKDKDVDESPSEMVVNSSKDTKCLTPSSFVPSTKIDIIRIDDDDDDLVIVSKTDDKVPNEDEVFACDVCAHLANTEIMIVKHLQDSHGIKSNKFHPLSKKKSETPSNQDLACNVCDIVLPELKLRRHFLDSHTSKTTYSPYRYKCGICYRRFLISSKVKMHFTRCHPGFPIKADCMIPNPENKSTATKNKLYSCTMCSYTNSSPNACAMRSHLRGHLKPILCNHCSSRFKYCAELTSHSSKEHPDFPIDYTTLEDVQREFTETLKEISKNCTPVTDIGVTHNTSETPKISVVKNVARKSTSAAFMSPKTHSDQEQEYSSYGIPSKELDLSNVVTTFELEGLEYTTTAEQMMKMFNMDTYVDVSDSAVDILPIDKS